MGAKNMKKISIAVCIMLVLSLLVACAKPEQAPSVDEMLSLGDEYMNELNYEGALAQFLEVMEAEPMNPLGYIGAAEAYVGLEREEDAIAVLQEEIPVLEENGVDSSAMQVVLEELMKGQTTGVVERLVVVGQTYYRSDGSTWYKEEYTFENGYVVKTESTHFGENSEVCDTDLHEWKYDGENHFWGLYWNGKKRESSSFGVGQGYPYHVVYGDIRKGNGGYVLGAFGEASVGLITGSPPRKVGSDGVFFNTDYERGKEWFKEDVGTDVGVWFYAVCEYNAEGNVIAMNSYSEDDVYLGRAELEYAQLMVDLDSFVLPQTIDSEEWVVLPQMEFGNKSSASDNMDEQ